MKFLLFSFVVMIVCFVAFRGIAQQARAQHTDKVSGAIALFEAPSSAR